MGVSTSPVLALLAQRGHRRASVSADPAFVFPARTLHERADAYYDALGHYAFRIFLRDAIAPGRTLEPQALSRHCGLEAAREYLARLEEWGWTERDGAGKLAWVEPPPATFGPTLEWYVREVLERELCFEAERGVRLEGPGPGGDYDVLGAASGRLLFVEVKSSPPRHIERSEVRGFLERREHLAPDISIFFVDTSLRMKDKVVAMFEEELGRPLERLAGESFRAAPGCFVTNSQRDAAENLALCLRRYFSSRMGA